jgi:hypothetical protein
LEKVATTNDFMVKEHIDAHCGTVRCDGNGGCGTNRVVVVECVQEHWLSRDTGGQPHGVAKKLRGTLNETLEMCLKRHRTLDLNRCVVASTRFPQRPSVCVLDVEHLLINKQAMRCAGRTQADLDCKRNAVVDSDFCAQHGPSLNLRRRRAITAHLQQPLGPLLGCGEQGCTYVLDDVYVVKVTPLRTAAATTRWDTEVAIGRRLGTLQLAPLIIQSFQQDGLGVLVMTRLRDATTTHDGTMIRVEDAATGDKVDHLAQMPVQLQHAFVRVFESTLRAGVVHMDNHLANLGYLFPHQTPCLFDFGFAQERDLSMDGDWGLAFSLGQIMEHCPPEELVTTVFFQRYAALLQIHPTIDALSTHFPMPTTVSKTHATLALHLEHAGRFAPQMRDLYVGTCCYASLLALPVDQRSQTLYMGVIYAIRTACWVGS